MYCIATESGHYFTYNSAVQRCIEHIGWKFQAWLRAEARLKILPDGWSYSLGCRIPRTGPLRRIFKFLDLIAAQRTQILQLLRSESGPIIFFAEWFDTVHLATLLVALTMLSSRNRVTVWVHFHRQLHRERMLQRLLLELIEIRLGRAAVKRFCITADLVAPLSKQLRRPVHFLPHPYVDDWSTNEHPRRQHREKLLLLWPGVPNQYKGWGIVRSLAAQTSPPAGEFAFAVSDVHSVPSNGVVEVVSMGASITRSDYVRWFREADGVLLPYSPAVYGQGCSGVFMEAVCAGIVPLVHADTWMARELQSAALSECIIDWNAPNVLDNIHRVVRDQVVHRKLAELTKLYRIRHSLENVGSIIEAEYSAAA
jgi:hypothetical protein